MDNRKYTEYLKSEKWKRIAAERMKIDNYTCVCCGSRGTATNRLEVHHLSYKNLYYEETRIYEDLVTLCHVCHKSLHNVMNRKTGPNRYGWNDNSDIPRVHVFTFSGLDQEHKEVTKNEGI